MKHTYSYQLEDQVAMKIKQIALQLSYAERGRITQGEVLARAIKVLEKDIADRIAFDIKEEDDLRKSQAQDVPSEQNT